jgi:hypothetical protein
MVARLKSISSQIHWSSLLKAAVFALAWFVLRGPVSFWLYIILALYLYFIPISESGKVAGPFLVLLLLSALEPPSILFMVIFGAIFLYILLIKGLVLIDRKSAYEVLVFFLSFILFRDFYIRFGDTVNLATFLYAFLAAFAFSILFGSFISCFWDELPEQRHYRRMVSWLTILIAWQVLLAGLFLPLDYVYQSVIAFLVMVLFIDLVSQYLFLELSRTKVLVAASVVFSVLVVIMGSARWGL